MSICDRCNQPVVKREFGWCVEYDSMDDDVQIITRTYKCCSDWKPHHPVLRFT